MSGKRVRLGSMPISAITHTVVPGSVGGMGPPALGMPELQAMADMLVEVAPDWSVELQGMCADDASLIIMPDSGDDSDGPTFMLSRETLGYRLDQVQWDRMTEVGHYTGLMAAMETIRQHVGFDLSTEVPLGITRH